MKKAFLTLVALIGAISLVGCSTNDSSIPNGGDYGNQTDNGNPDTGNNGDSSNTDKGEEKAGNAIVVYFLQPITPKPSLRPLQIILIPQSMNWSQSIHIQVLILIMQIKAAES